MPKLAKFALKKDSAAVIFNADGSCQALIPDHGPDEEFPLDSPEGSVALVMLLFSDKRSNDIFNALVERFTTLNECDA